MSNEFAGLPAHSAEYFGESRGYWWNEDFLHQFQLTCQRGKTRAGEGNDLIGEQVPALFKAAGLRDIEVRLNDRPSPLIPPYDSPREYAIVRKFIDHADRDLWIWSRAETLRYFLAGGGRAEAFDHHWSAVITFQSSLRDAFSTRRFSSAGGSLFYLVWGWKK